MSLIPIVRKIDTLGVSLGETTIYIEYWNITQPKRLSLWIYANYIILIYNTLELCSFKNKLEWHFYASLK